VEEPEGSYDGAGFSGLRITGLGSDATSMALWYVQKGKRGKKIKHSSGD
jgi:hypothetical protein